MVKKLGLILTDSQIVLTILGFCFTACIFSYINNQDNSINLIILCSIALCFFLVLDIKLNTQNLNKIVESIKETPFEYIIFNKKTRRIFCNESRISEEQIKLEDFKGSIGDIKIKNSWFRYWVKGYNSNHVMIILYESTKNKKLESELELIINNTNKGIIIIDDKYIIKRINNPAKEFLGLHKELEYEKYDVNWILFKKLGKNFLQLLQDQSSTNNQMSRHIIKQEGNNNIYLNIKIVQVDNSNEYAIILYNVTEFENQRKKLSIQSTYIDDYLKLISHDIKSPINSIGKHIGLVKRYNKNTSRVMQKSLEYISDMVIKTKNIINTVLKVSENVSEYQKELVSFGVVAEEVQIDIEDKYRNTKIDIVIETDFIYADRTSLYQLLYNLVDNAIKYTCNPIKHVIIGINSEYFFVKDFGIGISKKDIKSLFTSFKQLNSDVSGHGLGLKIVKGISDLHGWRLEVQPNIDEEGTEFKVYY